MPKEQKKRGRRAEKKRKREEDLSSNLPKRQRSGELVEHTDHESFIVEGEAGNDFISFREKADPLETVYYGQLTEEEQDYYASINTKLELNDFEDAEEKQGLIEAVWRETRGKEMKVACSQSCSRYLERLILASGPSQLQELFKKFQGNFLHLVQHRFASHCCETLFQQSARFMYMDETIPTGFYEDSASPSDFEGLFLEAVNELSDNLGYLLTEKFASHAVRLLIIVLAGEPLDQASTSGIVSSRKKEKIELAPIGEQDRQEDTQRRHNAPQSFQVALKKLVQTATSSLTTTYLQALASHPTGNPVLQLLLRLELNGISDLAAKEEGSVFKRLFPDDSFEEGTETAKFIQGLLYDPSGSRIIETIAQNASGKIFKKLYRNLLKDKMTTLAKNDIASYVAICIMGRLGKDELTSLVEQFLPEIPDLVIRNRLLVIRTMVERCQIRGIDLREGLLCSLEAAFGKDPSTRLSKMLKLDDDFGQDTQSSKGDPPKASDKIDLHASLLVQSLLQSPLTSTFVHPGLLTLPTATLLSISLHPSGSRIIQSAILPNQQFPSSSPSSFRRQFIPLLYPHIPTLAVSPSGSRVVDALWDATSELQFMKERVARELQGHEADIRESRYGRVVWRNWWMDGFTRRRGEWVAKAKAKDETDTSNHTLSKERGLEPGDGVPNHENQKKKKSGIELAREKFAARKAQEARAKARNHTTSSTATVSANA